MDFLSTKALTIAVGVMISLAITSAILFTLNQISGVYQGVYETDISIRKQFNEFAMYDNTEMTGLEMINTAKKYKDNARVSVTKASGVINTTSWLTANASQLNDAAYTKSLYKVTYEFESNDKIKIKFTLYIA